MFERLPDWVSVAGEWLVAIFLGLSVIAVMLLICGIIVYGIRQFTEKDDEQ